MFGLGLMATGTATDRILATPGLFGYWNAERVTIVGGLVTVIPDISGNNIAARNLTIVSTGASYILNDPLFNNKPSVGGTVANVRFQSTFDVALVQPSTWYLVMNIVTTANVVFWRSNAGNFTGSAGFNINASGVAVALVHDAANAITSVTAAPTGAVVSCVTYNGNNTTSAIYLNNSLNANAASPSQGTMDTDACTVLTIGTFATALTYNWTCMAAYSGLHDATTRKQIMEYLGNKYGITSVI